MADAFWTKMERLMKRPSRTVGEFIRVSESFGDEADAPDADGGDDAGE